MSDSASPSNALTIVVVERLIESGLLRSDKRDALITKIASGGMKEADWKLEIELAQAKRVAQA